MCDHRRALLATVCQFGALLFFTRDVGCRERRNSRSYVHREMGFPRSRDSEQEGLA